MTRVFYLISGLSMLLYFASQRKNALITMRDIIQQAENESMIMTTGKTCGERNNNPGNIRPASYTWQGQTGIAVCGVSGRFVVFSSPVYGIRAIVKDLRTKYGRGLNTIRKIITVYAPPSENNTEAYIQQVAKSMKIGPDTVLNMQDQTTVSNFVVAIIKHENGRVIYSAQLISEGVALGLK